MTLKDFWSKTSNWLQVQKLSQHADYQPQVDDEGLINEQADSAESPGQEEQPYQDDTVLVKTIKPKSRPESLEKLQAGFDKLVEQLQGINEHLDRQVSQHEDLMSRIDQLPELLQSFPATVENQKLLTEQLLEQLKATTTKTDQFIDTIEKIPTETARQTDALVDIDHQLAAAADTDVQMAESFNKFHETLDKLNQSTIGQTDGIFQMSKTFATSDRYLKYLMTKQNRRFMWIFITAMGVCVFAIFILTVIIIYLTQ